MEKLEYQKYKALEEKYQNLVSGIATYRLVLFLVMIFSFIGSYYYYPVVLRIVSILSLIIFLILVFVHDKYYKVYDYYAKYVLIMDTYLKRENGEWKNFLDTGSEFLTDKNLILSDLDVLGKNSLFQYLSVCKTLGGREKLVEKLSNQRLSSSLLHQEQEAIQELSNSINFCLDFQVALSCYDGKKVHLSKEFDLLEKKIVPKKRDFILAIIFSVICLLLFGLGYLHILSYRYFYGMFLFNFLVSFMYSYIFKEEFLVLEDTVYRYGGLRKIFSSVISFSFSSLKLKKIQTDMKDSMGLLDQFYRIDNLNSLRNNFLSNFFFNGLFCINLLLLYLFSLFLNHSFVKLRKSILDVEELEAMISIASLGILRRNKCMPVLSNEVEIKFLEIQHPLLDENVCVSNDFAATSGVEIITGSNMGGKTSFLRTIGINLILMNAGSYVCAKDFRASYFKLFTSMRVTDDIEKGISTFYGELLRIQEAICYVDKGNMLVLIDEIFKGTNYQDRIYGAKEVIKRLHTNKTITFITTHDFELCEEKWVVNYHVKESYEGDKILFDYKIRKGKCTSTNARYLMKKLGIIE